MLVGRFSPRAGDALTRESTRVSGRGALRRALAGGTALCYVLALPGLAVAGPEGGSVAYGGASIAQSGSATTVTQTTDRAVLDWQRFNLGRDESARFAQPSSSAVAVNRIHDTSASVIQGTLSANGQVVLVNPSGVLFAPGSRVDVQSLVASTASPSDADAKAWAQGQRRDLPLSVPGAAQGTILNAGSITAGESGLVGFVAPNVVNDGVIAARLGKVHLASGDTATLDLAGDGLVNVAVSEATTSQLVANHGLIQADGGTVLMSAAAGAHVASSVINMDGVVQARSLGSKNGRILLEGDGDTHVSGKLDVSGNASGERGGSIQVTGRQVTLTGTARLDASGDLGGGNVQVGGGKQGSGTLRHAKTLTMAQGAVIDASALTRGDGGQIILWSDQQTDFAGHLSARGGALGGQGGFAETSGHDRLRVTGTVDLTDAFGGAGTWLLDPTDITIYNRSGSGDGTNTFTASQLEALAASANVSLSATNNITLDLTGDTITFATSGRTLTLTAGNQILTASTGAITTNNGAITLTGTGGISLGHALTLSAGTAAIALSTTNAALTLSAAQAFNSDTTLSAGTNTITTNAITMGAGKNLTLTADDVAIGGNLSGTGTLTLTPFTGSRIICVNYATGSCAGTNFGLSTTDIGYFVDGWSGITLGSSSLSATIYLGASTWNDPLTTKKSAGSYATYIYNDIVGLGNTSFTLGTTSLYANITTAGQGVSVGGNLNLQANSIITTNGGAFVVGAQTFINAGNLTVNSGNGNITLCSGGCNAAGTGTLIRNVPTSTITLNAGTGTLWFNGKINTTAAVTATAGTITTTTASWGSDYALGNLSLTSTNTNLTVPDITGTGSVSLNAGTGTITTGAIATGAGNLTLTADDLAIGGNLSGTGTLTLQPSSASRVTCINTSTGSCASANFNINTTEIGYFVDGWSGIIIGTNTWGGNGQAMYIGNTNWTDPVTFKSGNSTNLSSLTGTGNASFNLNGVGIIGLGGGTIATAGGNVTFSNMMVANTGATTINTNGGQFSNAGSLYYNAGYGLTINTGGGAQTFGGLVSSTFSASALTLNAGSGAVSFGNTVNTAGSVTASAGSFTFGGAWGGTYAPASVSLTSANTSFTMPALTTTGAVTLNAGTGTITTGTIAVGAGNLTLTADDLVIGGNLSGTGTLTLQPSSAARLVYINYGSADGTNLNISTTEIAFFVNGWSQINLGKTSGSTRIAASSWYDPLTISGSIVTMSGALTGNDNASFTFLGDHVDLSNTITTNGGKIDFSSMTNGAYGIVDYGTTLTSNGGNILLGKVGVNGAVDLNVNSGGGNINLGAITDIVSAAGKTLSFNAGTGTLTFSGTVNGAFNFTGNAGSFAFNGAWGGTRPLGAVSLTSTNTSFTMPALTTTGNVTLNAGTGTITTGAIAVGAGNLTLTADDLAIGGNLSGTGTLTLKPSTSSQTMNINNGAGGFNLSTAELAYLVDGWSQIAIGGGSSQVNLGATTWNDPVTFYGATKAINGTLTGLGNASFTIGSNAFIDFSADVTTAGGAVNFGSAFLSLQATGKTISTNGGALSVKPFYGNNKTVTFDAGSGLLTIASSAFANTFSSLTLNAGSFSFGSALSNIGILNVTSPNSFTLPATTTTGAVTLNAGTGTITTGTIATGSGNLTLTADDMVIGGNLSGTGTLTIQPSTASRIIYVNNGTADGTNLNLSSTELGYLVDGWAGITFSKTGNTGTTTVGTTTWRDPVTFMGGSKYLSGDLTGTGNASINFTSNGLSMQGHTITTAGQNVSAQVHLFPGNGSVITNGGAFSLAAGYLNVGPVGGFSATTNGGTISLTRIVDSGGSAAGKTITLNAGSGSIVFSDTVNTAADLTVTAGSYSFNGAWGGTTAPGTISLTNTVGGFALPAITAGNVYLSAAGAVTQTGAMTATNLLLAGTGGAYTLSNSTNNIGTVAANTGLLSLTNGNNNLTVGTVNGTAGITTTGNVMLNAGTATITTGTIAVGAGNLTLTADDLAIGGNLSGTGILTLQPTTITKYVRLNYSTGDFNLDTTEIGYLVDGWSQINLGNSSIGAYLFIGATTWTDPVVFRNNQISMMGALVGTDNASFTFSNSTGNNSKNITTAGGNITFNSALNLSGGTFASNGGIITLGGAVTLTGGATLNAGSGGIVWNNTVNGAYNLTATGGSFTFGGTWGGTTPLSNVSLTSANTSFTMPALTTTGNVTLNAGTGTITTGAIAVGAGNLTLTADDLAIGGNLSGTGTLTLQPSSASRVVCVNYTSGSCASGVLALSTTEVGYLADGWNQINIGRSGGNNAGSMYIGASTFKDPTTFYHLGSLRLLGTLTGTGDASFAFNANSGSTVNLDTGGGIVTAGGSVTSNAGTTWQVLVNGAKSITTNGGAINFNRMRITASYATTPDLTLNSGGGTITLSNVVADTANTNTSLTLNAGAGTINFGSTLETGFALTATAGGYTFGGAWGGTTALGSVNLTATNASYTLPAITTTGNASFAAGTGTITVGGAIATGAGNLTFTADGLNLGANISGTGTLLVKPSTLSRAMNLNNGTSGLYLTSAMLDYIQAGWGSLNFGATNDTGLLTVGGYNWKNSVAFLGGSGGITFANGSSTLASGAGMSASVTGGNILFDLGNGIIALGNNGNFSATIGGGGSKIYAASNGGIATSGTGNITLTNTQGGSNGISILSYALNLTANGTGNILLSSAAAISSGVGAITTNGGTITLNSDTFGSGSGHIIAAGSFASNGGAIIFGGGTTPLTGYATCPYATGTCQGINITGTINAGGGNITLNGKGAANSTVNNGQGVYLASTSALSTTGSGKITINGIGGGTTATTGTSNYGVDLRGNITAQNGDIVISGSSLETSASPSAAIRIASGTILTTGTGNILLTAANNGSALGQLRSIGGSLVSGGGITYVGDTMDTSNYAATWSAVGTITIRPSTASQTINLNNGTSGLAMTSTMLDKILSAGSLVFGSSAGTGLMTVGGYNWRSGVSFLNGSGEITFTTGSSTLASGAGMTATTTSGNLTFDLGGGTLTMGNNANFSATIGGQMSNASTSGITTSGSGGISLVDTNTSFPGLNFASGYMNLTTLGTGNVLLKSKYNVAAGNAVIQTQGGTVTLWADSDANGTGNISLAGSIASHGGDIIFGGGASNPLTGSAMGSNNSGAIVLYGAVDAGGGNITLNGVGAASAGVTNSNGIQISGSLATSGNGTITLNGKGGGTAAMASTTNLNHGVRINGNITTQNGDILINASSLEAGAGTLSRAIMLNSGTLRTTGSGNIVMTTTNNGSATGRLGTAGGALIAGGDIRYIGDALDAANYAATWNAGGNIVLRPYSTGATVGIGSGAGTLGITNNWLSKFTWGNGLWLGGYGNPGDAGYVSNAGNMTINLTRSFAGNVNLLSNGNITNSATGTLTTTGAGAMNLMAGGNITFASGGMNFNASGTGALTMRANSSISLTDSALSTHGGALTLNADRDASGIGYVLLNGVTLTTGGGGMVLGGGLNPLTDYAMGNSGGVQQGISLSDGTNSGNILDAGGGDITINGRGYAGSGCVGYCRGVNIGSSVISTSGAGKITINGIGGGTTSSNAPTPSANNDAGVALYERFHGPSSITAENGDIVITGQSQETSSNAGSALSIGGVIRTTGTGNIVLTAANGSAVGTIRSMSGSSQPVALLAGGNLSLNAPGGIWLDMPMSLASARGNLSFNGPLTLSAAQSLQAAGMMSFGAVDGSGDVTAQAGGYSFGGDWGSGTPLGAVSLTAGGAMSLPSITAASLLARTTGAAADLTLASGHVLSADSITLAAGRHVINQTGMGGLALNPGGRWLIYSQNTTGSSLGGLVEDFRLYGCAYAPGGACLGGLLSPSASGNGWLLANLLPLPPEPPSPVVTEASGLPSTVEQGRIMRAIQEQRSLSISNDAIQTPEGSGAESDGQPLIESALQPSTGHAEDEQNGMAGLYSISPELMRQLGMTQLSLAN